MTSRSKTSTAVAGNDIEPWVPCLGAVPLRPLPPSERDPHAALAAFGTLVVFGVSIGLPGPPPGSDITGRATPKGGLRFPPHTRRTFCI
jgi:hypothetical protein